MKSDKKTSVRLSSQQIIDLDKICKNNGCSRSKAIKSAIDLVTKGTSEIDFGTKKPQTREQESKKETKQEPNLTLEKIEEPKPTLKEIPTAKITSIDGIPIEKFQSGEYYIQDSKVVKRQELGIIEKLIDDITN